MAYSRFTLNKKEKMQIGFVLLLALIPFLNNPKKYELPLFLVIVNLAYPSFLSSKNYPSYISFAYLLVYIPVPYNFPSLKSPSYLSPVLNNNVPLPCICPF